jgi:hypothetical protein
MVASGFLIASKDLAKKYYGDLAVDSINLMKRKSIKCQVPKNRLRLVVKVTH